MSKENKRAKASGKKMYMYEKRKMESEREMHFFGNAVTFTHRTKNNHSLDDLNCFASDSYLVIVYVCFVLN